MPECAFCPETANLSLEHLWSDWMNALFPGKKRFTRRDRHGNILRQWVSDDLSWKARVVCKPCNEGWMSNIESKHAEPAMAELIHLKPDTILDKTRAESLAIFAFKTAVVFDHVSRNRPPFFSREVRHRFRETLAIPATNVAMWMATSFAPRNGEVLTCYTKGKLTPRNDLETYVCTYAIGRLVFQVVGIVLQSKQGLISFGPAAAEFESLSVPFWPLQSLPLGFRWPPIDVLRSSADFENYAIRWKDLRVESVAS
jgi:hypothetical protein